MVSYVSGYGYSASIPGSYSGSAGNDYTYYGGYGGYGKSTNQVTASDVIIGGVANAATFAADTANKVGTFVDGKITEAKNNINEFKDTVATGTANLMYYKTWDAPSNTSFVPGTNNVTISNPVGTSTTNVSTTATTVASQKKTPSQEQYNQWEREKAAAAKSAYARYEYGNSSKSSLSSLSNIGAQNSSSSVGGLYSNISSVSSANVSTGNKISNAGSSISSAFSGMSGITGLNYNNNYSSTAINSLGSRAYSSGR